MVVQGINDFLTMAGIECRGRDGLTTTMVAD